MNTTKIISHETIFYDSIIYDIDIAVKIFRPF